MALNLDLIGKKTDPQPFTYDQDRVILYALGIGAGVKELDFVYEKNLKVFPTFAVIPGMPSIISLMMNSGLNLPTVLHGEQKIVLHGLIPPSGTLYSTGVWTSAYDKGDKGAIVNLEIETKDESGKSLFDARVVLVDRSAGNFGGDKGPPTEKFDPPEGKDPDFRVEYDTSPDQAALYRLSGDKNPLHIDPEFAKLGGLERPILHGLCTYGFAGRAILYSVCDGDPARFKSFAVRFMGPVFPGETLVTSGWKTDRGYIIQTRTGDGRLVLGNALAEVS
ncbi:MAG: MaoC family dehydratase N-terminal domain-containing protein [Deltaproteobacteria bacterium]|nr:MaoC family dehydratase N-terminal domain-containing protein [Deltaproteobacteria bacterium]